MEPSEGDQSKSKYVVVKFSDLIDFFMMLVESNVDLTLLEFGVDLLPCAIEESDVMEYFNSFQFSSYDQVQVLHEKSKIILDMANRDRIKV